MPYLLRAWTDRDEGIDRAISEAIYPEYHEAPGHSAWFPARQLGAPREARARYMVEAPNGLHVAYASLWELRPRRYRFDLAVRPERQRQGIGAQLLSQVMNDAQAFGATGLQARVRDDQPHALEFVTRRGFRESHRMGAYRGDFGPIETEGGGEIEITTLAAVQIRDSDYRSRFHELYSAARDGWPDPDPDPAGPTLMPIEIVSRWLGEVQIPEAFFIAKHQERYVGFSSVFAVGTAVHPEYRRRGIATRLKAISIADAQRRGVRGQTIGTASPGMQAVLERLGYRRLWSEIRLILEIAAPFRIGGR
jgi:GNAT superfamily N-acetyltransferase